MGHIPPRPLKFVSHTARVCPDSAFDIIFSAYPNKNEDITLSVFESFSGERVRFFVVSFLGDTSYKKRRLLADMDFAF